MAREIVSNGEDFAVHYLDRSFGKGPSVEILKVSGTPTTPGFVTVRGHLVPTLHMFALGNNGAGSLAVAGLKVGDKVVQVVEASTPFADITSSFESTISVAGHIRQTSASNLSAVTLMFVIAQQS
jgi:hypothetical protein